MAAGTLTLTCLLLLAGQAPAEVWPTNQRHMKIPVDIQPSRRPEIRELILFVSTDQGRSWQQERVAAPNADGFPFFAEKDGEYWFRVALKTHQDKLEPENIYTAPPEHTQKILVDTVKPSVRLLPLQRQGEEILVQWEIQDEHPDPASLKLFYRQGDTPSSAWLPVPVTPALVGRTAVRVLGGGPVSVRLEVKDFAGNTGFGQGEVPGSAGFVTAGFTPDPAPPSPLAPSPGIQPFPPPPTPFPAPPPSHGFGERVPSADFGPGGNRAAPAYPRPEHHPEPGPAFEVVASSKGLGIAPPPSPVTDVPGAAPLPRSLPRLQVVNSTDVIMEYELEKVGPSGLGKVELYLTRDDGQTWVRFADDPEVESAAHVGRCQRLVRLPGEGLYGFALVALSKAGRGKRPPQPGDLPEMRVEVDTSLPEVELGKPIPDPDHPNCLLLRWSCKDRNLAPNGVTLEWAERRDGVWQPIIANLANTGRHSWQLPPGLPVYVFLRVRVRDTAGNEGVAVTSEGQLADLSEPVGRLINVTTPPRQP